MTTTATRPRMDPRIRERRVAVKRDEGRRRLRFLVGFAAVLALAGACVAASHSPLLDVDHIDVTGAHHVAVDTVLATARISRGGLMINTDAGATARRVERLSWVASASVQRVWPGTLRVRIVERRAAAAVPARGGWATVDAAGRVLERTPDPPPGLAVIADVPALPGDQVPPHLRAALVVAAAIPPRLRDRVPGVFVKEGGLELSLRPSGVVRFGGADRVGEKLTALETLLARIDGPVAIIDVRVPDAPVLTRR